MDVVSVTRETSSGGGTVAIERKREGIVARDRHERMRRDARTRPSDKCAKGAATRVGKGAKRAGRDAAAKERKRNCGSRGTSLRATLGSLTHI